MTTSILIREAVPADMPELGRLGALLMAIHHDLDAERFIPVTSATDRGYASYLEGELVRSRVVIRVAVEGDAILGYAYAGLEGTDYMALRGPAGVLYDLVVDPSRRGIGIGRMLLDAISTELASRGAPQIVLSTAARNGSAQQFFAKAGFRPTMVEMTRETGMTTR